MWLGNLYWDGGKTLNKHVWKDMTCFTLVGHFILWHAEVIIHADNVVQYKYGCVRAKGRTKLDESILLKGPDSDIKPVMRSKSPTHTNRLGVRPGATLEFHNSEASLSGRPKLSLSL